MHRHSRLDEILLDIAEGRLADADALFQASRTDPAHLCLFSSAAVEVLATRLLAWQRFCDPIAPELWRENPCFTPHELWRWPLALAQWLIGKGQRVVAFAGPPGIGKTTFVALIAGCMTAFRPDLSILCVSFDDFYFSKRERAERGLRWRAQPGAHDLPLTLAFLEAVRRGEPPLIPRFDHGRDDRLPSLPSQKPVDLLLFEGWLLGLRTHGYDTIADRFDSLLFLDGPIELTRQRRFAREAKLRLDSDGQRGFSAQEMENFWLEVLEPGIATWIRPIKAQADLVLSLDASGHLISAAANPTKPA